MTEGLLVTQSGHGLVHLIIRSSGTTRRDALNSKEAKDWLTLLANLGVVAGLVLLAYEVNQANLQAEAAAAHARRTEIQVARTEMALSQDLAEIYVRATDNGVETLTAAEKFRLTEWEWARLTRMVGQIEQYQMGFLDRETIENTVRGMARSENGLWADLGVGLNAGPIAEEVKKIREEMESRNR